MGKSWLLLQSFLPWFVIRLVLARIKVLHEITQTLETITFRFDFVINTWLAIRHLYSFDKIV